MEAKNQNSSFKKFTTISLVIAVCIVGPYMAYKLYSNRYVYIDKREKRACNRVIDEFNKLISREEEARTFRHSYISKNWKRTDTNPPVCWSYYNLVPDTAESFARIQTDMQKSGWEVELMNYPSSGSSRIHETNATDMEKERVYQETRDAFSTTAFFSDWLQGGDRYDAKAWDGNSQSITFEYFNAQGPGYSYNITFYRGGVRNYTDIAGKKIKQTFNMSTSVYGLPSVVFEDSSTVNSRYLLDKDQ